MRIERLRAAAISAVVLATACGPTAAPDDGLPARMLWAWDATNDLRFLEGRAVGVAFLSATIGLEGDAVSVRRRRTGLALSPSTPVVPVARIEARKPSMSDAQRTRTLEEIVHAVALPGVTTVQLDFDATVSQRPFYRALVAGLRARLPPGTRISVTALASWCAGDDWLGTLGADEAVPMLFRLGPDTRWVDAQLEKHRDFRRPACRANVGLSTDEPRAWVPEARRTWLFHPRAWTRADVEGLP